jgi:hypothetical protein
MSKKMSALGKAARKIKHPGVEQARAKANGISTHALSASARRRAK